MLNLTLFGILGCQPSTSRMALPGAQSEDAAITAQQIQIDMRIDSKPVTIRGDRMVSDNTFSNVTIEGNVHLEMPPLGEMSCARLWLTPDKKELQCEGNVRGRLSVPKITKTDGGAL